MRRVLVLLLVLGGFGCDSSVDPFIGTDLPFTIWGQFNPKSETQTVRVFLIEDGLRLIEPDAIDAVVTSTNIGTGQTRVWRDSVIQLPDNDFRHVYWSGFRAEYGETYRLEVGRADGRLSHATVRVPEPVSLTLQEPNLNLVAQVKLPVLIEGAPPSLPRIDVVYDTQTVPDETAPTPRPLTVTINYDGRAAPAPGGFLVEVDLREDFRTIQLVYDDADLSSSLIELMDIQLRVHVGNEEWVSPAGVFDPDFLVEPGVLSNVENGFGFVGAGYIEEINWLPEAILIERAGFTFVLRDP